MARMKKGGNMTGHLNQVLSEADAMLDKLNVHDASSREVMVDMQAWLEPRTEVATRLDYAVEGNTPGYLGRREA